MEFRIANTFTDRLSRQTSDDQKDAKITALDLQLNPANLSLSSYKLDNGNLKYFWSVRVSTDIRLTCTRLLHFPNYSVS